MPEHARIQYLFGFFLAEKCREEGEFVTLRLNYTSCVQMFTVVVNISTKSEVLSEVINETCIAECSFYYCFIIY